MLDLAFNLPADRPPRFMFIGAHCDDIEIGCGGTVIELLRRHPDACVHWVVMSAHGPRIDEAQKSAVALLRGVRDAQVSITRFTDAHFPSEIADIKSCLEEIRQHARPDVVFAHSRDELHQDHRVVGEVAWNTFRDHLILEYEIPKYDGGLGSPSMFVPLAADTVRRKVNLLMRVFKTQHGKHWFTRATFQGLMRLRGIECNAPSGYAEAFYSRKLVIRPLQ